VGKNKSKGRRREGEKNFWRSFFWTGRYGGRHGKSAHHEKRAMPVFSASYCGTEIRQGMKGKSIMHY
jgi:hypothetical protein